MYEISWNFQFTFNLNDIHTQDVRSECITLESGYLR